jgi:hypothetical protein
LFKINPRLSTSPEGIDGWIAHRTHTPFLSLLSTTLISFPYLFVASLSCPSPAAPRPTRCLRLSPSPLPWQADCRIRTGKGRFWLSGRDKAGLMSSEPSQRQNSGRSHRGSTNFELRRWDFSAPDWARGEVVSWPCLLGGWWKSPRGGVNRAKLKFSKNNHNYKPG